jgi:hypothetical protein
MRPFEYIGGVLTLLLVGTSMQSLLLEHAMEQWKSSPAMRIQDAYKWLYHATLGGEHAIRDESGLRRWLEQEWNAIGPALPNEPQFVSLTPDGSLLRVNLRPYKARNGDREMLLAIFILSSERFSASKHRFHAAWRELGALLKSRRLGHLTIGDWTAFDQKQKPLGYPPVHHSKEYEDAYQPAYRVVLGEMWLVNDR